VVGPRHWRRGIVGVSPSPPQAFHQHTISYDSAFGGLDIDPNNPKRIYSYLENPSGIGYSKSGSQPEGTPLPRSEELQSSVTDPSASYIPMALGPIGRHWKPRLNYVGTYDEKWQSDRLPFMPDDFDPLYFQAAPPNQQIDYVQGGERILLANLCEEGRLQTAVPRQGVKVGFINRRGDVCVANAVCDTLSIEPDNNLLCMVWRANLALQRDFFELREIVVMSAEKYNSVRLRARARGKTYYDGLGALVADRGKGRRP
jgi:hypothetical protein